MTDKEQINDSLKNSDKNFNENCTHEKEQIIIDGLNVLDTIDGWVNLVVNDRCTAEEAEIEYATAEVIQNYILDINKQLARKTQECEELKERKLKLELNENHNKNEIKKLKKRIRKDREFFKNKISSLTLARKQFLEALDHFNWQIAKVYDDILDIINKAKGEGNEE